MSAIVDAIRWAELILEENLLLSIYFPDGQTVRLRHFGISELKSFMVTMPLLIMVWHGFVGWLFDRWRFKRHQRLPMKSISNR